MARANIPGGMLAHSFEALRNDYTAAKSSRFRKRITGVSLQGTGADYHVSESDYLRIIEHARFFDRNDQILGQAIDRLCNLVLRDGPKVEPQTGNGRLDAELKARFDTWAKNSDAADVGGRNTLHDLSWLALRHMVVDGDVCMLPLKSGHIESVEAHRLRTPRNTTRNVVLGVLLDGNRRPLEYWFTKEDVNPRLGLAKVGDTKAVAAYDRNRNPNVFHVMNPKRVSQTRGVSALAPIFDTVGMHDDIEFAKLVQQQIVSCFGIIRERTAQALDPDATGAVSNETLDDGTTRVIQGIAPGLELTGAPGEQIKAFSPGVPNAEFFDHVKLILGIIAVNLGIPLQVLLLDPTQTNFSGWRGAMDQAKPGLRRLLNVVIQRLLMPVYAWKVRQFLAEDGALRAMAESAGDKVTKHIWSPPYIPYIEPNKDAQAETTILNSRLNSRRRVLAQHGLDIEDVDAEHIADTERFIAQAVKAARRLNKKYEEAGVDWREIVNFNAVGGGNADAYIEPGADNSDEGGMQDE